MQNIWHYPLDISLYIPMWGYKGLMDSRWEGSITSPGYSHFVECSWLKHFISGFSLSTEDYKWNIPNCLNGKFDKILRRGGRLARGEVTSHPKISEKTDTEFKGRGMIIWKSQLRVQSAGGRRSFKLKTTLTNMEIPRTISDPKLSLNVK